MILAMADPTGEVLVKTVCGNAFGCLVLYVHLQVILDLPYPPQRPCRIAGMALGAAGSTCCACLQSASYWGWTSDDEDSDHNTSLIIVGAFFWPASGILIALFQGCCCCASLENAMQSGLYRPGRKHYLYHY
jgi:hypothetical protein